MMFRIGIAAGLLLCALHLTAAPAKKKTTHKSSKASASTAKPKSGKTGRSRKASLAKGRHGKRGVKKAAVARWKQQAPAPERYKEIQQALADKGYYRGEVNGAWGPDSVAALRNYQREQKIDGDGKLNSLSLIGLGLGPKRPLTAQADPAGHP